ncbi:uncharacterized protein isoform X2 [Rhodnius prolixus]
MVPIGKLGFMKGRIINTNQVFVSLGGGWFVKTCSAEAQEICTRRILECNGMLEKLEKEKKLFEGWTALSSNQIFASGESKEIIEPYDDKVEASWRVRHAEKVKEYRKKLAKIRKELEDSRDKERSEEELWRHLDLLEMQEEFEDELERMGENSESGNENSSELDSDDDSAEERDDNTAIVEKKSQIDVHSVRFSTVLDSDEDNVATGERCDSTPHVQNEILEDTPKVDIPSILSKKQRNENKRKTNSSNGTKRISFADLKEEKQNSNHFENSVSKVEFTAVGQVKERSVSNQQDLEETHSRPVSKFKSSRLKK